MRSWRRLQRPGPCSRRKWLVLSLSATLTQSSRLQLFCSVLSLKGRACPNSKLDGLRPSLVRLDRVQPPCSKWPAAFRRDRLVRYRIWYEFRGNGGHRLFTVCIMPADVPTRFDLHDDVKQLCGTVMRDNEMFKEMDCAKTNDQQWNGVVPDYFHVRTTWPQ